MCSTTAAGKPAAGKRVVLRRAGTSAVLADTKTNADGRVDKPLLDGDAFAPGSYEIAFHAGDYFRSQGVALADPAFLDVVPVRFSVAAGPRLSPAAADLAYGYSTYRGS